MSEQIPNDPAGTTHQFQNFVAQGQQQPAKAAPGGNVGLIVGIVAVVAVVALLAVVLATMM
ncbi:hypothetical protein [Actinomadura rupiterrae]|uniref:hypothetical protein n=1 Tax=Actinomadura rupiterrae TaxID=559627 RepID=UPI0020A2A9B3|nr:hypothetical protein [Actinomadura rupiterrae]MCP2338012.1 hypothetical protein [Actinomadura rupiterrae]